MKINIFQQGDSIEFLHKLIEEMDKELNGKTKNRNWHNVPDLHKLLLSQKYEMNICTVCNQESIVDLSDLSLELISTNQLKIIDTVSGALKLSFNQKIQNLPCSHCKKNTKTISKYSQQLPKYLWLKISRIRFNEGTRKIERTNHHITPEKNIMIDDTKSNSRKTYTLTGGIIHNGGTNSGHYIYITYQNNAWFSISDDKVVKIKESEAKNLLKINSTLITYKEVNESPKINQKSEANNQWNNKAESMASSFTHKNPSQGKESKNIEKPKIYNPWQGEINRMEKLLFFERIAAEWSSPSDKLINLNKDKNITENQKYARINTEKLS
jgi:ubiquitin C-terminal hydrolase